MTSKRLICIYYLIKHKQKKDIKLKKKRYTLCAKVAKQDKTPKQQIATHLMVEKLTRDTHTCSPHWKTDTWTQMEHRQTDRQIASARKWENPVARFPYTLIILTHKTYVQGHDVTRQLHVSFLPDQQTCMQKENTYITIKTYLCISEIKSNEQDFFIRLQEINSKAADGAARLRSKVWASFYLLYYMTRYRCLVPAHKSL